MRFTFPRASTSREAGRSFPYVGRRAPALIFRLIVYVTTADSVIDDVLGRSFEFECAEIALRDASDDYRFVGPGSISGRSTGAFSFRLHNRQSQVPGEFLN